MKYLILLLNVLGFWLMADAAHAEPISLAITSIAGFFSSIGAIGKLVLTVAINIGLSLVEKALAKKDQPQPAGTKLEISMGDDHPMSFIVGSYATAGKRKYAGTWGDDGKTPNAYFTDVIEIGSLPNHGGERGLTSVWIDDQKVGVLWEEPHPDGRGFPVLQYRANGKDYLWIKFLDGTQTSPDPFLTAKFGSHAERPWKPTMIGRGCQVVILTSRYNTDLFSGVPSGLFEPHPLPLYDIRKDSSVGGNGVQRWTDPSTWQPSTNPAVMIYNLARGVYYGAEWVYGGQNIGAFCLPATNWMAAANACDASVKLDDGSSEPAFRAGYDVQCDQEPLDAVSELLKGCNGRMAEVGGIFKMLIGTPGAAVYSFSDDDIIVTEEQDFQPFPSLSATYNAIEATYPEPAEKWATKDAPGRYNTDLEAQDGNRRLPAQIQLLAVPFANQVQRVGLAMIQDYRRFRVHQVSLPPDAYPLEPNDVVSWSSVRNGYEEKKFLVVKVEPQPNFLIVVTLKEVDPADYDWHPGLQLPTAIGWLGPITPPSQPMIGWTVEPSTIKDSGGIDRRPAIKVSCAPDLDDVRGVWVQVRLKDTGDVFFDSDSNPYASPYSWLISGQWTLPNTDYEARGRYLPESNRATDWSAWLTVKTPNVLIQAADVLDGAIIQSKIADAAVSAAKIMDAAVSNLKLADQAVSTAKLQVAAVTADVLASGAVISTKLADSAVTAAKLAQGVVDATKLASGIKAVEVVSALPTTGNVEGRQVFLTTDGKLYRYHNNAWTTAVASADINGTLTDAQIAAVAASKVTGQLTDAQIAAVAAAKVTGTLVSSQIADAAVTNSKLAALAVDATKLADASVTAAKIADAAVSTTKFANGIRPVEIVAALPTTGNIEGRMVYLTTDDKLYRYTGSAWTSATPAADITGQLSDAQIAAVAAAKVTGQITSTQITDGAISTPKLAAGAVTANELAANSVVAAKIAANAIVAAAISAGAVTTNAIAAGAVTATQIAANTITAGQIAAGAIGATQIAADAVTTAKIAAGAVTTSELAANAVTAGKIAANAVTATNIAAGAITAKTLLLQDFENLVPNGRWEDNTNIGDYWAIDANYYTASYVTGALTGVYAIQITKDTGDHNGLATGLAYIPVIAGESLYFETAFKSGTADVSSNGAYYRLGWYDANKSPLATPYTDLVNSKPFGTSWTSWSSQVVVPAGAAYARAFLYNTSTTALTLQYDRVVLRRANAGSLIVDGTITATKLAAGSVTATAIASDAVTADAIAANAVTAAVISAGAVTTAKIAASAVTASQIAANTITAGQIAAGAIGATQIAADAVTTAKIAAGAVTANELASNAVTAGKVAANAIVATNIAAGAITADKMVLADFTNRCENPNFGEGDVGWVKAAGVTIINDPANAYVGNWYMNFSSATGTGITRNSNVFPVNPGEQYFLQAFVKATGTPDRSLGFRIRYEAADKSTGVASGTIAIPTTVGATYTEFSAAFTVPANAVYAWVDFTISPYAISTGSYQVGFVSCQRRNTGNLIVDGAITAVKIAANAVTAASIAAGAITADAIAADAVTTAKIAAGAVTATTIASGAITADKIAVNTITAGQIAAGAIGATQIAADAVTTAKIAAGAVTTSELAANAITAGKIAANAVVAGNVAANAITARELILQDWENLVPDNQLQSPASWSPLNSSVVNPSTTQAFTSKGAIDYTYVAGAGYLQILQSQPFAIVSGQPYLASAQAIRMSGTMYGLWLRVHWLDASGSLLNPDSYVSVLNYGTAGGGTAAGMQTFSAEITPPATAYGAIVRGYIHRDYTDGNVSIGGISFLRKATANLIVDGTITGAKIAATTITAANIAAGTLTAAQIAASAITATQLAAGAVTANELAANAVTAGKIAANAVLAGTIAAGAVSAAQIAAGAITADKLASNSVTTNALAVGSGKNLLQNANFAAGTDCWNYVLGGGSGAVTFTLRQPPASWSGAAQPTLMVDKESGPDTGSTYVDVRWTRPDAASLTVANLKYGVPCTAGESFEATAYIAAHRCVCELCIEWRDATGTVFSYSSADTNNAVQSSSTDPDAWPRLRAVGVAPANAVCAGIHIRKRDTNTGQTTSYMFVNKPMLCRIPAGATEPTPWSDGGVVLITPNGIVANAVTADNIAANAITAGKIAANAVTAGTIAAGAVTATTIAAGTITGDKLAANTIGADQIAANAITAKQLVLTDFSNMADNGWQTGTLDGWVIQNQQNFYNDTSSGDVAGWILQSNGRDLARSNYVAVSAGETYAFDVWVYNTDPGNANVYAGLLTPAGVWSPLNVPGATTSVKNTWVRLQGRVTIPSGYAKASMLLQVDKTAGTGGTSYWSKPVMRRAVSAELIVDGAITANKIAANAITAAQIAAGAVTTDKLILGGVTYDKIASGAVTAVSAGRNAGGQTIGSDQTVNLAACGITVEGDGRVMISAMTLGQYNKNGNSQNAQPIGCNIFRDGTAIFSQTYYLGVVQTIVANGSGGNGGSNSYTYTAGMVAVPALYDAPGAGYHTYTLQIYCPNNTIAWNESNIIATAFKR